MLLLIWLTVLLVAVVIYLRQNYKKLEKSEVHHPPAIPLLGNLAPIIFRHEHIVDNIMRAYLMFPEDRFYGTYSFFKAEIVIRDLELLKKITVKDFDVFTDRRNVIDEIIEPVIGRSLIALRGNEWRDMRSTLSPAFTSSKIRLMIPFMIESGDVMIQNIKKKIQESGVGYIDVESKEQSRRYANDVIATCAFGLKVDANGDDEFFKKCAQMINFGHLTQLKFFAFLAFPNIMKKLKLSLFSRESMDFFNTVVLDTIKHREENHIIRNDVIHLLMEVKKGQLSHDIKGSDENDAGFATVQESSVGKKKIDREWTENDLVAQAVLFLFAGFETVSTTLAFVLHEIAINPDVQEKLLKEIREHHEKNGKNLDYNSIQELLYLDMVISETLRLWPAAPASDRLCIKNYNIGKAYPGATKDYIVRKGEFVNIPIWGIHHDPNYFPNPYKFDPERFSEERKHDIKPFTYMPFGIGPRNCIGSRFALCEMKIMLYKLLLHVELSPCEKTCIPTKLSIKDGFNMKIEGGHWIRMKIREEK